MPVWNQYPRTVTIATYDESGIPIELPSPFDGGESIASAPTTTVDLGSVIPSDPVPDDPTPDGEDPESTTTIGPPVSTTPEPPVTTDAPEATAPPATTAPSTTAAPPATTTVPSDTSVPAEGP